MRQLIIEKLIEPQWESEEDLEIWCDSKSYPVSTFKELRDAIKTHGVILYRYIGLKNMWTKAGRWHIGVAPDGYSAVFHNQL